MKKSISGINKNIKQNNVIHKLQQMVENRRLDRVAPIIEIEISKHNRKMHHTTMNLEVSRIDDETIDQRAVHQNTVSIIATLLAQKLGLNENLVRAMASAHDVGHTFLGHDGEYMISDFMEAHNLGVLRHNAKAVRELVYRQKIQKDIMDSIKQLNPTYSEVKLKKIEQSLWKVFDGIQSHNGESTNSNFKPNVSKTKGEFLEETIRCYTEKGFDKKIVPSTPEGCLMKLSDIIGYVGRDLVDGLKSGIVQELDEEYINLLLNFGIKQEELDKWIQNKKYDRIDRAVQIALIKDVIENSHKSKVKSNIRVALSPRMAKTMYGLRDKNYREVGAKTIKSTEKEVFPIAIDMLSTSFADLIIKEDILDNLGKLQQNQPFLTQLRKKHADTLYEGFVEYLADTTPEDMNFITEVIRRTNIDRGLELSDEEMQRKIGLFMGSSYLATLNDLEFIKLLTPVTKLTSEQYQNIMTSYRNSKEANTVSEQFIGMLKTQREEMEDEQR